MPWGSTDPVTVAKAKYYTTLSSRPNVSEWRDLSGFKFPLWEDPSTSLGMTTVLKALS